MRRKPYCAPCEALPDDVVPGTWTSKSPSFTTGPWMPGPYAFVWVDALTQTVREGGRIINVHALIAVGVNADGHREILGIDVATAEDGAGLADLPALADRPRPVRRPVGHLRHTQTWSTPSARCYPASPGSDAALIEAVKN